MGTYEKTHPWLKFQVDLEKAHPKLWIMLGECQSKCEHISGAPLQPAIAKDLHLIYLAKGVQATTAIEGNTLSEEEVKQQIKGVLKVPVSKEYLKQETQNIIDECNSLINGIREGRPPALNVARIKELNRAVLKELKPGQDVVPGEMRKHSVGVGQYRGAPWEDREFLLERLCQWLDSETFSAPAGTELVYAIIKSILSHLYLAWIHAFGDGNGRTARLMEYQILISSGVPTPAGHLLSNHYNQTRTEYYRQLDQASKSGGDVLPFLHYAVQGFVDGLRSQIQVIQEQQLDVSWRDLVYEAFRGKKSGVKERQRNLVLALSTLTDPVPPLKLMELSPRIAGEYARKTSKALSRDINELIKMGLVQRDGRGVRACRELILAFLPVKADAKSCAPPDLERQ